MAKQVIKGHEYCFVYAKNISVLPRWLKRRILEEGYKKTELNIGFKKIG